MAKGPTHVSRVPNKQPSSGVFKGGKRKNFVRINLKVCSKLIDTATYCSCFIAEALYDIL